MALKWHPDRPGGDANKVVFLLNSSNKLRKHTKLWATHKKGECMINSEQRALNLVSQVYFI